MGCLINTKEKRSKYKHDWYIRTRTNPIRKAKKALNQRNWSNRNPEYQREYNLKNQNKIIARRKKNRHKTNQWTTRWLKNPHRKLIHSIRVRVRQALKGQRKTLPCIKLIGCDLDFLKKYLESKFQSGMTWNNYGRKGWHIDHIIPCASFDLSKLKQQKICFHYSNLQPLWAIENIKKGKKLYGI